MRTKLIFFQVRVEEAASALELRRPLGVVPGLKRLGREVPQREEALRCRGLPRGSPAGFPDQNLRVPHVDRHWCAMCTPS